MATPVFRAYDYHPEVLIPHAWRLAGCVVV